MISITNPPLRKAALALARRSAASSSALTSNGLARGLPNGLARSLPARLPQDVLKATSVSAPARRREVSSPAEESDSFLFGVGASRPTVGQTTGPSSRGDARASRTEDEMGSLLLPLNACF